MKKTIATLLSFMLSHGPFWLGLGGCVAGALVAWQVARGAGGASWALVFLLLVQWAGVLLAAFHWHASRQARRRAERMEADRALAEAQLNAVIDILPENGVFSLFDASDRLVHVNEGYKAVYPRTAHLIVPGARFEDLIRHAAAVGDVLEAQGREEIWVQQRLAEHRAPVTRLTQALAGDRWLLVNERRTASGWTVALRTDITLAIRKQRDLEHARLAAQQAQSQLHEALDAMPLGMALFDENDRLVYFNQRMAERGAPFALADALGKTHEELLRPGLKAGSHPDAAGEEAFWIARRLAERGRESAPEVHEADGHWTQAHERRTPSGYRVRVRLDITELVEQREALERARHESQVARALLESAIEALPVGIEIFDPQDRLVLFNQHLARMYAHLDMRQMVGWTFESILRVSLRNQWITAAIGREEEWLKDRFARRGTHREPLLQEVAGGRWVHSYENRTEDGYIVAARMEVTDLVQQQQALERANERLAQLSATDGLTGIANRRHFDEILSAEWLRGARQQEPLCLMMIDIDHFKRYNDRYGHLAGDECLRRVADLLQGCIRRSGELVARYGGEEFALLLPATDTDDARLVAQRCMDQIHAAAIAHDDSPTAAELTLSMGIACAVPDPARRPEALVDAADAALYRAKNSGRHRFEITGLFGAAPDADRPPASAG